MTAPPTQQGRKQAYSCRPHRFQLLMGELEAHLLAVIVTSWLLRQDLPLKSIGLFSSAYQWLSCCSHLQFYGHICANSACLLSVNNLINFLTGFLLLGCSCCCWIRSIKAFRVNANAKGQGLAYASTSLHNRRMDIGALGEKWKLPKLNLSVVLLYIKQINKSVWMLKTPRLPLHIQFCSNLHKGSVRMRVPWLWHWAHIIFQQSLSSL